MTYVPTDGFASKSVGAERIPRSTRQLTRDIREAIVKQDAELLQCLELHTRQRSYRGIEIVDAPPILQLKKAGQDPEWFIHADAYREVLAQRSDKKASQAKQTQNRESKQSDTVTNGEKRTQTATHETKAPDYSDIADPAIRLLLKEKDQRIEDAKSENQFHRQLLQGVVGRDVATALVEATKDVDPNELQQKITAMMVGVPQSQAKENGAAPAPHTKPAQPATAMTTQTSPASTKPVVVVDVEPQPKPPADSGSVESVKTPPKPQKKPAPTKKISKAKKKASSKKTAKPATKKKQSKKPKWYGISTVKRFFQR